MKKVWEVWNELLEKPLSKLTKTEGIVRRVNIFLVDFEMGSWLYNLSPEAGSGRTWTELRATADSVTAIGARSVARGLRDIADIVERGDAQKPGTWAEFLSEVDPANRIPDEEKKISAKLKGVRDKLTEFTLRHFKCESG
jgi:hypothetical protein